MRIKIVRQIQPHSGGAVQRVTFLNAEAPPQPGWEVS